MLHRVVRCKGVTCGEFSLGIDLKQMIRDVLDGFLRLRACARPIRRPHAVQTRRRPLRTDVFLQETDLIRRDEELVVTPVLDVQVVAVYARHLERLHAEVLADAVRDMHNVIAGRNLTEMPNAFARARTAAQLCLVPPKDVLLGEDDDIRCRQLKACAQRSARSRDLSRRRCRLPPEERRRQPPSCEHIADDVCPFAPTRQHEDARLLRKVAAQLALKERELPPERRHRHHLKRDERTRRTGGQFAAHEGDEQLMSRSPLRDEFLP